MPDFAPTVGHAGRARTIALVLIVLLAAVSLAAALVGERGHVAAGALLVVLLLPLFGALPGLWQRNRRTYAWATLCVTPHFVYALTEIVANPALRTLAAAMFLLSLGLVVALVAYLRTTRG